MIHYLCTEKHPYTMKRFLARWGQALAPRVRIVTYEQTRCWLRGGSLGRRWTGGGLRGVVNAWYEGRGAPRPASALPRPPVGTWIFSDVDRLSPAQREEAGVFRDRLVEAGAAVRVHNDPLLTMGRYELLRTLHGAGINAFDVRRLTEARRPARYPVFLRTEDDHVGAASPLLEDDAALDAALARLTADGRTRERRLIVEFHGERDDRGLYRKYAAWFVGGQVLPGHLFFGPDWMLKEPKVVDERSLREERAYLEENPHAEVLARVARLGHVDYGRVDYAVVDGRVQVYEINTNPGVPSSPSPGPGALRADLDALFTARFIERFRALDVA